MVQHAILQLAGRWRETASTLRRYGAETQALTLEACAELVEETVEETANALLTLAEASELSGYSRDHLGRLIADGTLPNAGERYAPRIRRGDLPRKPGHTPGPARGAGEGLSFRVQMARSVVESD